MRRLALVFALLLGSTAAAHDWNGAIAWRPYAAGLAEAKKTGRPVCLVVSTEWCPHCRNYARVFHDPAVVEASRSFVMIHVDKDAEPAASGAYAPDGEYIPRTMFLDAQGRLSPDLHAPRPRYLYFYNESDPRQLLASMEAAARKAPGPKKRRGGR
jgi:protein-disulfide reductase (glutathione)